MKKCVRCMLLLGFSNGHWSATMFPVTELRNASAQMPSSRRRWRSLMLSLYLSTMQKPYILKCTVDQSHHIAQAKSHHRHPVFFLPVLGPATNSPRELPVHQQVRWTWVATKSAAEPNKLSWSKQQMRTILLERRMATLLHSCCWKLVN